MMIILTFWIRRNLLAWNKLPLLGLINHHLRLLQLLRNLSRVSEFSKAVVQQHQIYPQLILMMVMTVVYSTWQLLQIEAAWCTPSSMHIWEGTHSSATSDTLAAWYFICSLRSAHNGIQLHTRAVKSNTRPIIASLIYVSLCIHFKDKICFYLPRNSKPVIIGFNYESASHTPTIYSTAFSRKWNWLENGDYVQCSWSLHWWRIFLTAGKRFSCFWFLLQMQKVRNCLMYHISLWLISLTYCNLWCICTTHFDIFIITFWHK